ncbi:MAG: hypothetical protein WC972_08690 [Trueperaceae bacterium]|jgi:hypothetical protein|nr:hypothetical protein [Truepera sp.]HRN17888.1 hypothetical protein [Trueperaceae bacterium]HRQ09410.1 hypothetical protein [Trueperaceae bacterium]
MDAIPEEATVGGRQGVFVVDEERGLMWETAVQVTELLGLIELCGTGHALEVRSNAGVFHAMARRWWVLPMGDEMLVRIELERTLSA